MNGNDDNAKIQTIDIAQLIEDAREDPNLLSKLNIDELLDSLESSKNDFLEGQTIDSIAVSVFESLKSLPISRKSLATHCQKLSGYRYVDELHILHKGKYVRWIRLNDPEKLILGGIVVDVRFADQGVNVLCRMTSGRFLQYRFDQCLTYQKLTEEEQLILMLYGQV